MRCFICNDAGTHILTAYALCDDHYAAARQRLEMLIREYAGTGLVKPMLVTFLEQLAAEARSHG